MNGARRGGELIVLVPMLAAAVVFWPVAGQFFLADDFYHLFRVRDQPWPAFLLQPHAGHVCIALNAMFAAEHALFGMDPKGWFVVLVAAHVVNVALCFRLVELAGGGRSAAFAGGLLWGLVPLHAQSLTWVTMSGQVVATTCVLAVLCGVVATRDRTPGWPRLLAWVVALLVAGTAHGAGMAAALAVPVAAFLLRPPGAARRRVVGTLACIWPLTALLVAVSRTLVFALPGMLPASSPGLAPWGHLANIGRFFVEMCLVGIASPFLGFLAPSPTLATAAIVVVPWVILVAVACWLGDGARRRAIVAMLAIAAAVYAATAYGRGGFYERLVQIHGEPGTVPRYHYLPTATLMVAACLAGAMLAERARLSARVVAGATAALALVVLVAWSTSGWVPEAHADSARRYAFTRKQIRDAIAQATPDAAGIVRIPNPGARGVAGVVAPWLFPGWAAVFVLAEPGDVIDGRTVRFAEPNERVRGHFVEWRRTGTLLVPPSEGTPEAAAAAP
jgi:hypothetical protein